MKQRTALEVAVESGIFPPRRLHVLARFRIGDILIVSERCPSNTARGPRKGAVLGPWGGSWVEGWEMDGTSHFFNGGLVFFGEG